MFNSLRVRLPLLFLAGILLAGAVTTVIAVRLFQNFAHDRAVSELTRGARGVAVTTVDADLLALTLAARGATVERTGADTLTVTGADRAQVGRAAADIGAVVTDLHGVADDLESAFAELIHQEATP